ncbi:alanine--glyoxylate aminotransferase 2 [Tropilaelaps mercedesae]|uniref:Alanine--glyoxylate aminotransferase 2, mitochondrial n=1 Tax=Tropilaelaps mercedesae TaxID=418985 RepID=A0A1V9XS66_9ACAR|nr:alanine--glyoxylate aminotransferase 2 [Tropilaelaps mercedesae]
MATMPPCSFKPDPYTGPKAAEILALRQKNLNPSLTSNLFYSKPLYAIQGYMQWLWDEQGHRYLDMFAGIVTVSVGHCHPKVTAAAERQLRSLWHTSNIYLTRPVHEFAEKLTSKLPGDLKVCYFVNSGSEANDLAMMLMRAYTGGWDVISLRNAYHGMNPYCSSLCAVSSYKRPLPGNFGVHHAMNADPYRGLWGGKACRDGPIQTDRHCDCSSQQCQAADGYADQIEDLLKHSVSSKKIAGFFAESIQGVGGTVEFPKGYLKKVYEMVRARGGLCVADEVQTGFGRLGSHFWGFETHGVIPDIVTMAKGIGNGFPLAAVVTTPAIAAKLTEANFFNTFGGNPVASAVGLTVLDVIDEERLQANCADVGTQLLLELNKLRSCYPIVGDVRGKGLMIGVELVEDRNTRQPLAAEKMTKIMDESRDRGLLIGRGGNYGNVLRIKPPMCVTREDANFTVEVLSECFRDI